MFQYTHLCVPHLIYLGNLSVILVFVSLSFHDNKNYMQCLIVAVLIVPLLLYRIVYVDLRDIIRDVDLLKIKKCLFRV